MLALGIAATSAIFSMVYTVLLRPLPFAEPERVVQIWESRLDRGWRQASFTEANFREQNLLPVAWSMALARARNTGHNTAAAMPLV